MAKCTFHFQIGDRDQLFAAVSSLAQSNGGTISGDATSGSFTASTPIGSIAGTYSTAGTTARVIITKKPLVVSCSRIENEVRKFLARQAPTNQVGSASEGVAPPRTQSSKKPWGVLLLLLAATGGVILGTMRT